MAQLTLYLDEETERLLKQSAQRAGVSQSRWVAEVIRRSAAPEWPAALREALGGWQDFPEPQDLRAGIAADVQREPI